MMSATKALRARWEHDFCPYTGRRLWTREVCSPTDPDWVTEFAAPGAVPPERSELDWAAAAPVRATTAYYIRAFLAEYEPGRRPTPLAARRLASARAVPDRVVIPERLVGAR